MGSFICWGLGHVAAFPRYLAHGQMFAVGPTLSAGLALAQPYIVANAFLRIRYGQSTHVAACGKYAPFSMRNGATVKSFTKLGVP